jgi:hypothetical protein
MVETAPSRGDISPLVATLLEPRPSALLGAEEDKKAALEGCRRGYSDSVAAVLKKETECKQNAKGNKITEGECEKEADKGYAIADETYARCVARYSR